MTDGNENGVGWVPLVGEFEVGATEIRFKGKRISVSPPEGSSAAESKEYPALGVLLSSYALADGDLSAEVEFERITPETICELAVSYDPNARHMVTAGLGGAAWAMFTIREFGGPMEPGPGVWVPHRSGGDRANMEPGRRYRLDARLRGAQVTLSVDGVAVGAAEVSSPSGRPRQVGLLCQGDHSITIRKFHVDSLKPRAFVVMQFSPAYDDVYRDVVREVLKNYEVSALRADEVAGPGLVISDIVRELATSQLIIADITPTNPNVYFEVGYALALGKPTILLAKKGTSLPFDVAGFRVLFYEDSIGGKSRLEEGLRRHLDSILAK